MNRAHKRQLPSPSPLLLYRRRYPFKLTSPQRQQRNKQITFSPEHIFAPKFTPRYTPISRTMSPTHVQPFFRRHPHPYEASRRRCRLHSAIFASALSPFLLFHREFPPSHSCTTFPTLSKEVLSFSLSVYTHIHTRTRTALAGLAYQVDSLVNGRARFRLWRSTSP